MAVSPQLVTEVLDTVGLRLRTGFSLRETRERFTPLNDPRECESEQKESVCWNLQKRISNPPPLSHCACGSWISWDSLLSLPLSALFMGHINYRDQILHRNTRCCIVWACFHDVGGYGTCAFSDFGWNLIAKFKLLLCLSPRHLRSVSSRCPHRSCLAEENAELRDQLTVLLSMPMFFFLVSIS